MRDYPNVNDDKGVQIRIGDIVNTSGELDFETTSQAKRIELMGKWDWSLAGEAERERSLAPVYKRAPDGIVVAISDFDGDVDDEGRSIGINPRVGVQWPDVDDIDWYSTTITSYGNYHYMNYDADEIELECDDLRVIKRDYNHERGEYRHPYMLYTRMVGPFPGPGVAYMPQRVWDSPYGMKYGF